MPGGVAPKFGSEKVSRYTGVSQLQLRVSRYTVQLRHEPMSSQLLQKTAGNEFTGALASLSLSRLKTRQAAAHISHREGQKEADPEALSAIIPRVHYMVSKYIHRTMYSLLR